MTYNLCSNKHISILLYCPEYKRNLILRQPLFSRCIFWKNYNTHIEYITYLLAHSFYAYLAQHIVVGVLLTCQSLDPEYKTL